MRAAPTLCALVALAAFTAHGQQGQPIRAESTLMEVEVQVADRKGRPVEGLTAANFQLFENGEAQPIRVFEYIDVPRETASSRAAEAPAAPVAPDAVAEPAAENDGAEPLRILISTQIGEAERPRTRAAIKKFIEKEMPAGAMVSLNGSPFLSAPETLLKLLDVDPLTDALTGNPINDRLFEMVLEPPPTEALSNDDLLRGRRFQSDRDSTDERFDQLGRAQMTRYIDMIRGLRMYPGKKMIVLFARGYSLGFDSFKEVFINVGNTDLLNRLKAESVRARISLYVADARGLESSHNGTGEDSEGLRPETMYSRRQDVNGVPRFINSTKPVTGGLDSSFRQQQDGLRSIAELTGGVAVLNSNNPGEIFEKVKEDLGGYYLLGYYLPERENSKQVRSLRIEALQVDAKLRYRKEFYDDAEFSAFLEQEYRDQLTEALGPIPGETSKQAPAAALEAYRAAYDHLSTSSPNFAEAASKLNEAVGRYEGFAAAWTLLGYAHERLAQPDAAMTAYEAAVAAEPGYLQPRVHLARLALNRQDWAAAIDHAIAGFDSGSDAEAGYYLAVAHYSAGEIDQAAQAASTVIDSGAAPRFPKIRQLLGLIQAARGDFVAATAGFEAYLAENPDAPDAELVRRQIRYWRTAPDLKALRGLVADEDWAAAAELSSKVLGVDPDLAEARYYQTLAAFRLNEYDDALETGRALLDSPAGDEFPQLDRMLGAIYEERGETELAAGHYRSFLTAQPNAPDAPVLNQRLDQWEKAKTYQQHSNEPGLRIRNRFGTLTVRSVPEGSLAIQPSSPTRELVNGDVVALQDGTSTTIECRPSDGVRIDLMVTIPYGQAVEIETTEHPVALKGLFYDALVKTQSGAVRLSAPWRATRLDLRTDGAPGAVSLPPGELLRPEKADEGWKLTTVHEPLARTYGAIRVRADAPEAVVVADETIPEESPVKMPWQAPGVVEALLTDRPSTTAAAPGSQKAASEATFTADVRMVSLTAAVTGSDGATKLDLKTGDFEVFENGRPQQIESLSAGTAPFNLALLLDFSGSTVSDRASIKLAARRLISTARPIDRVALYTLGDEMFAVASELNSDYQRLVDAVEAIPPLSGGSPLYDAIALAWAQKLRQRPGERNALVVLTDGVDNRLAVEHYESIEPPKRRRRREPLPVKAPPGVLAARSNLEFEQLLAAAARMETLIYPFLLNGSGETGLFPGDVTRRARQQMRELAAASGARVIVAESINDAESFHDLVRDLRSVYTLTYRPENQELDDEWRTLEVRVKDPSLRVRTRPGYFAR